MILYMIRHGESEGNFCRKHSGWTQVPLTEKGFQDAQRVGDILRAIAFDRIYSSDLLRARQTMETAMPGAQAALDPLLREMNDPGRSSVCSV